MSKVNNGKAAGKDKDMGGMTKVVGDMVVDLIWRVCNMTFKIGVVLCLKTGALL